MVLRLLLEGDADGDGEFEAVIGDTVPPGTALRVRATGALGTGFVDVRANGETLLENAPLGPGETIALNAPDAPGWVRATLALPLDLAGLDPGCAAPAPQDTYDLCSDDLALSALTSPIYVARRKRSRAAGTDPIDPHRSAADDPGRA